MKNLANYFNPNVTDLEIFVTVGMGTAEDTGWEFSDLYEASRERDKAMWSSLTMMHGSAFVPTPPSA